MHYFRFVIIIVVSLCLSGCGWWTEPVPAPGKIIVLKPTHEEFTTEIDPE